MIELFIDGKPAVIKEDTSFKLSLENQFFTKTSSYSFDVELPLNIAQNRAIFGDINRIDVVKKHRELSAKLVADNITILSGTVTITQVTESSVKVQLLGESASYKYGNKADKLYIDELTLGNWFDRTFPASYPGTEALNPTGSTHGMLLFLQNYMSADYSLVENTLFKRFDWVAYPIYNTEADTICNEYVLRSSASGPRIEFPYRTPDGQGNGAPQMKFAVQPFVWYMCELIAEATGFTLSRENNHLNQNDFYRRIFLANANINIECNKCLPHWTVNEWWEQIERTFGVTMVLSDTDKSLSLIGRDTYLNGQKIFIDKVIDEFTTDFEKEASVDDIVTQNVGFANSDIHSLQERISDEILDIAEIKKFETLTDLQLFLKENWFDNKCQRYIFEAEGRQYIMKPVFSTLKEVNLFRPRIVTENSDIDVELKFIPCSYTDYDAKIVSNNRDDDGCYLDELSDTKHVKILTRPDKTNFSWFMTDDEINNKANFVLNDLIFGDESELPEKEDTQDVAYIAIHSPQIYDVVDSLPIIKWPRAWLHEEAFLNHSEYDGLNPSAYDWGTLSLTDASYSLSLIPIEGQRNLASESINKSSIKIGATVKHCFKFISDIIPNTSAVFIIHGKKYLCEKIEVNITSDGIDKLMTGYFFALD